MPPPPVYKKPRVNMVKFNRWKERKEKREQFELKMVAFLAILDHKIAQKEAFQKMKKTAFQRSRSAARTLALKRQDDLGELAQSPNAGTGDDTSKNFNMMRNIQQSHGYHAKPVDNYNPP